MEFSKVITERETVRSFDGRKPSEEQLIKILEAGRIAPTAGNLQPQRVYVLESREALKKMDRVHPNRYNASLVLLVYADSSVELYYKDMNLYQVDGSIAATHMLLAAYDANGTIEEKEYPQHLNWGKRNTKTHVVLCYYNTYYLYKNYEINES